MTRPNLYQEHSGGDQQEPTDQSSTINNDDVDDTEAPAPVENVNVFTSDPSLREKPRCDCTCIQGPPTQGCWNEDYCQCIDCSCLACNCWPENALDVDDSPEQASDTLPVLPVGEGTWATLRRARENPQLARIAEQVYQVARAQEVPPRRREPLLLGEDELPVPIKEQLSRVTRAPDTSRRHRRYTDLEDREPREEWDDVCLMNLRRALSSAKHHHDLPHPAIDPKPNNTPELSNTSSDRILEALKSVDKSFRLLQSALDRRDRWGGSANSSRPQVNGQAQQQVQPPWPWGILHFLESQRSPQCRRSTGSTQPDRQPYTPRPIPGRLGRSSVPLNAQPLAEVERAGRGDAREEERRNGNGEKSDPGSSKRLSDHAIEPRPEKCPRKSKSDEKGKERMV